MTVELNNLLKRVRPRDTVQWLSDVLGLSPHNAHALVYKQIPKKRQRDLIRALLAELDRIDQVNAETRAVLKSKFNGETDEGDHLPRGRVAAETMRAGGNLGIPHVDALLRMGVLGCSVFAD